MEDAVPIAGDSALCTQHRGLDPPPRYWKETANLLIEAQAGKMLQKTGHCHKDPINSRTGRLAIEHTISETLLDGCWMLEHRYNFKVQFSMHRHSVKKRASQHFFV